MNIAYEKKFIDLLGYTIKEKEPNKWLIYDDDKEVGIIEYSLIRTGVYGYYTKMDSKKVKFNNIREENDLYESYVFYIKEDDGLSSVEMILDGLTRINIWSNKYGFISFSLDKNGLFFNFKSTTDNYNLEECVNLKILDSLLWFNYTVNYAPLNREIIPGSSFVKTNSLSIKKDEDTPFNKLCVSTVDMEGSKLIKEKNTLVNATIKEAIKKQEFALTSLNRLRLLLDEILPFNIDIINYMANCIDLKKEEILFFMNNEKNKKRSLFK